MPREGGHNISFSKVVILISEKIVRCVLNLRVENYRGISTYFDRLRDVNIPQK